MINAYIPRVYQDLLLLSAEIESLKKECKAYRDETERAARKVVKAEDELSKALVIKEKSIVDLQTNKRMLLEERRQNESNRSKIIKEKVVLTKQAEVAIANYKSVQNENSAISKENEEYKRAMYDMKVSHEMDKIAALEEFSKNITVTESDSIKKLSMHLLDIQLLLTQKQAELEAVNNKARVDVNVLLDDSRALKDTLQTVQCSNKELTDRNDLLLIDIDGYKKQIAALESSVEEKTVENKIVIDEYNQLELLHKDKVHTIEAYEKNKDDVSNLISEKEVVIASSIETINSLKRYQEDCDATMAAAIDERDMCRKEVEIVTNKNSKLEADITQCMIRVSEVTKLLNNERSQRQQLMDQVATSVADSNNTIAQQKQIDSLSTLLEESRSLLSIKSEENEALVEKLTEIGSALKRTYDMDMQAAAEELDAARDAIDVLEQEVVVLKGVVSESSTDTNSSELLNEMQEKLQLMEVEMNALAKSNLHLQREVSATASLAEALAVEKQALGEGVTQSRNDTAVMDDNKLMSLQCVITAKDEQVQELQRALTGKDKQVQQLQELQQDLQRTITVKDEQVQELQQELQRALTAKDEQVLQVQQELQHTLTLKDEQVQELQCAATAMSKQAQQVQQLQRALTAKDEQVQQLQDLQQELQRMLTVKDEQVLQVQQQLQHSDGFIESLTSEIEAMRLQHQLEKDRIVKDVIASNATADSEANETLSGYLEVMQMELDSRSRTCERLEVEVTSTQEVVGRLSRELDEALLLQTKCADDLRISYDRNKLLDEELTRTQTIIGKLSREIEDVNAIHTSDRQRLMQCQSMIGVLSMQCEVSRDMEAKLSADLLAAETAVGTLYTQSDTQSKELEVIHGKLYRAESTLKSLTHELRDSRSMHEHEKSEWMSVLTSTNGDIEGVIDALKLNLHDTSVSLQQTCDKLNQKQIDVEVATSLLDRSRHEKDTATDLYDRLVTQSKAEKATATAIYTSEVTKLNSTIESLSRQMAAATASHTAEVSELHSTIDSLSQQMAAATASHGDQLSAALKDKESLSQQMATATASHSAEVTKLNTTVDSLSQQLVAATASHGDQLSAALKDKELLSQQLVAATASHIAEVTKLNTTVDSLSQQLAAPTTSHGDQLSAALKDRESLSQQLVAATATAGHSTSVTELNRTIESLSRQMATATASHNAELAALKATLASASKQLMSHDAEMKGMAARVDASMSKNKKLQADLTLATNKIESLQDEVEATVKERDSSRSLIQRLQSDIHALSSSNTVADPSAVALEQQLLAAVSSCKESEVGRKRLQSEYNELQNDLYIQQNASKAATLMLTNELKATRLKLDEAHATIEQLRAMR